MPTSRTTTPDAPTTRRVAVVTGGSAGLGRAVVRELATNGWDVAVLARGEDGLTGAVADVEALGRRAIGVSTDVADRDAVEHAADRTEAELGPIDLWVNCAMVGVFGEFLSTDPADFERATQVNYFGFVNGTRSALSRMVPRDSGHVIQVGSALAHRGIPLQAAYCAAKHAVQGFTESVTTELIHAPFMDWYLAKTGYDGQQAPDKSEAMLPHNLYEPVPGDQGSTGIFSDQAHTMSPQVWAISNRRTTAGIGIAAALALGGAVASVVAKRR
jgi:NADP-dependent 3-hydroxy acid dehydrogenase YdfG